MTFLIGLLSWDPGGEQTVELVGLQQKDKYVRRPVLIVADE